MSRSNFGVFWSLALIGLSALASTQMNKAKDSEKLTQTQQAILQVEQEVFAAVKNRNTSALERILTDDFVYRSPGNQEIAKG